MKGHKALTVVIKLGVLKPTLLSPLRPIVHSSPAVAATDDGGAQSYNLVPWLTG